MEEWEKRLKHDKDMVNIQCEVRNIPIPDHPKNGIITNIPNLFQVWRGKEFWPKFEALGHSSVNFEKRKCKRG